MDSSNIQSVDIDQQMRTAYLDYAMSVIVARALPDARDGLKPVHRRILFGMQELGVRAGSSYKKSARIVGEVLGKFHPHGDSAVYDAMARLAQPFSMRYMLVDGQGNFGSVDGDAPAAMRYTEARLTPLAEDLLADIDKNTIDFSDNFDGSLQEPIVLPARLPNLLLNGSSGIAVGMATNIPPHNLGELVSVLKYMIERYDEIDEVSVEDLVSLLPGPDFPTGGIIVGREGILQAYSTGRGRLVVRGQSHIQEMDGNRAAIVITEIPYQLNKSSLVERIAELAREGRIDAITDLRDESDRQGMRIVIELRRGADPRKVLNQLYKYSPLQSTFGVHLLALVHGEPRLLSLKRALQVFIEHRQEVLTRRSQFELARAHQRIHILEGLLIAMANLDEVINTIRQSPDAETARTRLMTRFGLSELQAQAILDLQLRRLAALERQKIEDEQRETRLRIEYLEDLLAYPAKILGLIKQDLDDLVQKYGDERRTRIAAEAIEDLNEEDLVADQAVLITITQRGYIKRVPTAAYRLRGRGGRGVSSQISREEDGVLTTLPTRTLHTVLFFSNRGKVYSEKAYRIPEGDRMDRGVPAINLLALVPGERITAVLAVPSFDRVSYCTFATLHGRVKRMSLAEFANVRPSGILALNLDPEDELGWVCLTNGKDDIMLVSSQGKLLRFSENKIRISGRQAGGIAGMRLQVGDRLAAMEVVEPGGYLFLVTGRGYGKRCHLDLYAAKGRATRGMTTINLKSLKTTGEIASARVMQESDEVACITRSGMVLRQKVSDIRPSGRGTRGLHLINVAEDDQVVSLARLLPDVSGQPVENSQSV